MVSIDLRDGDLTAMSALELRRLARRFRDTLRVLAAERGNARCHITLHELLTAFLPEGDTSYCGLADRAAFLAQCELFYDTAQCPSVAGRDTCPACRGAGVVIPKAGA